MNEHFEAVWTDEDERQVREAVEKFSNRPDTHPEAIAWLKANPDKVSAFCMAVFESYSPGDNTGIYVLASLIKTLTNRE